MTAEPAWPRVLLRSEDTRGVPHTYANLSDAPAHQLIICTPAGFERYFARMSAKRQGTEPPEWAKQPLPEVTTLGPPIDPDPAAHQS
jgi:hypothetical protein